MNKKNTIRLTESDLKRVISESVKNIISELDWRTYANAAAAAKDRESLFKDDLGYPDRPMIRHYKDDGSLDVEKYQRDSDWQVNQSKQPEKFRRAAYSELSKEICGEEDFALFLAKYIPQHGVDDKLKKRERYMCLHKGDDYSHLLFHIKSYLYILISGAISLSDIP